MKLFERPTNTVMVELISRLNAAADAYYNGKEILTDYEYDRLLNELQELEKKTGIILDNSPTKNVGSPVKVSKLNKVKHEFPALSLDKTKNIDKIVQTFDVMHDTSDEVVVMWKLDGSTIQLTYENGELKVASTRGDGYIGQDITHNVIYIKGIPLHVSDMSKFIVRGEAIISYDDFQVINSNLPDDQKFKNPRNLAAASITMLDPEDMKDRNVQFRAFELVDHPNIANWTFEQRLLFCSNNNFEVVPNSLAAVTSASEVLPDLRHILEDSSPSISSYHLPVDGLVIAYNNTKVTDSLKGTEHHPNVLKGYAYKWEDEIAKTILRDIEWSPSRTGLLNPVAIFDAVELEGTTVSRASLHNYSIMEKFHIHIGDEVEVIKSNKIIPQIVNNLSNSSPYTSDTIDEFNVYCPSCGTHGTLKISKDNVKSVYCENENCPAKLIYKFEHFCERTAMNVEGLSKSTIEKFVKCGYLEKYVDLYILNMFESEIKAMEGFGEKSWKNLWKAIQISRNTNLEKFIVAVGIPTIGISQAKAISKYFNGDVEEFLNAKYLDFSVIEGIGRISSDFILKWLHDKDIQIEIFDLKKYLNFENIDISTNTLFLGKTFVVTGKVYKYKNRKQLEEIIIANGGKVTSTVTSSTSYLINNDITSTSSKNVKAKELNIPIITEDQFIQML